MDEEPDDLYLWYSSARRLRKFKELNAPKGIIKNEEIICEKRKKRCEAKGITEENFKAFCVEQDIREDLYDIECEYYN